MQTQVEIKRFNFSDLRSDWYASNHTLPRLIRGCIEGRHSIEFCGFPRQWLPVFEWFGIAWANSIDPLEYIPFFSDLTEDSIMAIIHHAKEKKSLRILIESATMYDPILSDLLYIIDNTVSLTSAIIERDCQEILEKTQGRTRQLILNGWQAYGRPSVRTMENTVLEVQPKANIAVALPCSRTRPYNKSSTHRKIYQILEKHGYKLDELHRIVITSLGLLPEETWELPQVMTYDAGVPDVYRILRLIRTYFGKMQYECVLDCLQFEPYSDVLRIAESEGIIKKIQKIRVPSQKHFYIRP